MIVDPAIVERIKGRDDVKPELAKILDRSRTTVNRALNENAANGPLTTVAAVEIISKLLKITESDVLIEQSSDDKN